MTTPRDAFDWWTEQQESLPHRRHVQKIVDLAKRHALDLDRCRLVCNQDRHWDAWEGGENRHYLGRTGSSGRLWLVED